MKQQILLTSAVVVTIAPYAVADMDRIEKRKQKRAKAEAGWHAPPVVGWESNKWEVPMTQWQAPPESHWKPPPTTPGWNDHSWGHRFTRKPTPHPTHWQAPIPHWNSQWPPAWDPSWPESSHSWDRTPSDEWVPSGSKTSKSKSSKSSHSWNSSGKGWSSTPDSWGTQDSWWGTPSYFMSPFSCGTMCIDASDAGINSGKLNKAVVGCKPEYQPQQWILHQNHDLVQIESSAYKNKCIAIDYSPTYYRNQMEMNCNEGILVLMSCDSPASRWYFTGGELLSFFCWSRGFSSNMATIYNVAEGRCNDELGSTNDLSDYVKGQSPKITGVAHGFCGTDQSNAESLCSTKCTSDVTCSTGKTCYSAPKCIVTNPQYGYCGTNANDAISKCATTCTSNADCVVTNQKCWNTAAECPAHDSDKEFGNTFMFIEKKEMLMLYEAPPVPQPTKSPTKPPV